MLARRVAIAALLAVLAAQAGAAETPNVVTVEARRDVAAPEPVSRGLGFVVEADGFALTTYRSLVDPDSGRLLPDLRVTVREDGATFPATVVGVEPTIDLGVVKLDADRPLRVSRVRRGDPLPAGTEIHAPSALDGPDTRPVPGRIVGLNTRECYQESLTSTMLRVEMPMPKSAAGAPVYSDQGEVIGLYTAYEPETEGVHVDDPSETHVLPIVLAFNIYDGLKQKHSLRSPWTGFSVRALDAEERRHFPTRRGHGGGVAVEHVWQGSPAAAMGVRPGDVLVQVAHDPITSVADFQKWLYMYGVGSEVKLVFVRDWEHYLVTDYVIEERPAWARPR